MKLLLRSAASTSGILTLTVSMLMSQVGCAAYAKAIGQAPPQAAARQSLALLETGANTQTIPGQILKTGINLNEVHVSDNSAQLADQLKLTPILQRIGDLRGRVSGAVTLENLATRQELLEQQAEAQAIIQECSLAIDYTLAEINAENEIYSELASTWQARANKIVQYSNWASYYSNGALWSVCEGLDIPTWKRPKYSISSGITGILAGITPTIFSLYGMHAANGRKYPGENAPNMLAKVFAQSINSEVDYPAQVWTWLNTVPPDDKNGKTRKDQLIDRWVADANIPSFTDRSAKSQIEALSGDSKDKHALNISLMQTRVSMLSQLGAEIAKMKRMLLELTMAARGEKQV